MDRSGVEQGERMNMRLGNSKWRRLLVLAVLLGLAAVILARVLPRTEAQAPRPAVPDRTGLALIPDERSVGAGRHGRDIFADMRTGEASPAAQAGPGPRKPAMQPSKAEILASQARQELAGYSLLGIMFMNGRRHVFLQHGELKLSLSEGGRAGNVVVERIDENSVLLRSTVAPLERELKQAR